METVVPSITVTWIELVIWVAVIYAAISGLLLVIGVWTSTQHTPATIAILWTLTISSVIHVVIAIAGLAAYAGAGL